MKKIGILSFHFSNNNYGAVLQSAALSHAIQELGYEAEHINFVPKYTVGIRNAITTFLRSIPLFMKSSSSKVAPREGQKIFSAFREKWVRQSSTFYKSARELSQVGYYYDAVVVGSDQVWRPKMYVNKHDISAYFLDFVPDEIPKISYAASFGVDVWEPRAPKLANTVASSLKRFSSISVREKSGVAICKDNFNVHAVHVLDPTLLVGSDYFLQMINTNSSASTADIVHYKLDTDDAFCEQMAELSRNTSLSCENIYRAANSEEEFLAVEEWLRRIRDSQLVVTDSFHCVCFAILFKKQFICLINTSRGATRVEELLSRLNLSERACNSGETLISAFNRIEPINYTLIDDYLQYLRGESLDFLKEALLSR